MCVGLLGYLHLHQIRPVYHYLALCSAHSRWCVVSLLYLSMYVCCACGGGASVAIKVCGLMCYMTLSGRLVPLHAFVLVGTLQWWSGVCMLLVEIRSENEQCKPQRPITVKFDLPE